MTLNFDAIIAEAHFAASAAARRAPEDWTCGFAWVSVSGNEPIARHCRAARKRGADRGGYGDKGYPNGWQWWEPGAGWTQSVNVKEAAAVAFRDVLAVHGIRAAVGSRLD